MQILVLGPHRSGTSACARLLNMMGAYMGAPESMKGPLPENRKGFWENDEVVDINKLVVHTVGCRWDRAARANFDLIYKATIRYGTVLLAAQDFARLYSRFHKSVAVASQEPDS